MGRDVMRVTMIETKMAAVDGVGIRVEMLMAGDTHDLPDDVAARFLATGAAVEAKSLAAAPENMAAGPAPSNKRAAKPRRRTAAARKE